ncbi:hypothetical protein N9W41_01345, partial [bacterium]|nr:hypothetical protein [bacterium]
SIVLKNEVQKNWFIRAMAFIITVLCIVTLYDVGEPRPLYISIPRGIINSLILNATLWLASFKIIREKFKYLVALFLLISGLGVFVATPYGWTLASIFLLFHFWLIFDLFTSKEIL